MNIHIDFTMCDFFLSVITQCSSSVKVLGFLTLMVIFDRKLDLVSI